MAKTHERVFALVAAGLFFVTSVAFTGAVLWQLHKDSQNKTADTSNSQTANSQQNNQSKDKMENYTPSDKPITELKTEDQKVGTGAEVKPGDTVTVHYTGALATTGVVFDSSIPRGQPATFGLDQVIKGWGQGVPGMKVGGKRRIYIPYALGYGDQGSGSAIPPKADLVFDVELIKIGQ